MSSNHPLYKIEWSVVATFIGVVFLFAFSIIFTVIFPHFVDPTWTEPSSSYQQQMYEISDPNTYISTTASGSSQLQAVYHLRNGFTLSAFQESETVRFIASKDLEKYITRYGDKTLKLSSELLLLRTPTDEIEVEKLRKTLQEEWKNKETLPYFTIYELFHSDKEEAFAIAPSDSHIESWVDSDFLILDETQKQPWHSKDGVIYIYNPIEYRLSSIDFGPTRGWRYDPDGKPISSLEEMRKHELSFQSRKELIREGEDIYRTEGCWYCHTDQTRTLVQDVVLNGSDSYPAPPSSPQEYIYQHVTFPGTRRIGPDISRTGIKRPSRDWHKGHFWSPKTASAGSIMPAFQHFFDDDPRGTARGMVGIPNHKFEAIYQYLMTKGTRITAPTKAWWLGRDPVHTKHIIDNRVPHD